jgi:hypothetical protein
MSATSGGGLMSIPSATNVKRHLRHGQNESQTSAYCGLFLVRSHGANTFSYSPRNSLHESRFAIPSACSLAWR